MCLSCRRTDRFVRAGQGGAGCGAYLLGGVCGAGSPPNRQIGERLHLAEKTVKNHISRLLAKLGVERRVQAAVIATQAQDRHRQQGS